MSRAQLTSTVEQNGGGVISPYVGAKNAVANGGLDYWQRGTSFTPGSNATVYTADRWACYRASSANYTISQISAGLNGYTYAARIQRSSTTTDPIYFGKSFETIADVTRWQGQTLTLSFYARAGSNYSATSNILNSYFSSGSGTDTNFTTEPGSSTSFNQNNTLTTSWQRFSQTVTVPAGNTAARMYFAYTPTGTAGTNDYYDITGVQLEVGSVATPFSRAGGTLQGELALCQRYLPALIGSNQSIVSLATGTTSTFVTIKMPVTARVAPTGISIPALSNFNVFNGSLSTANPTAISWDSSGTDYVTLAVTTTAGSPTISAGQADLFRLNTTSAYILFTGCEL
jgi:hypothetical protein